MSLPGTTTRVICNRCGRATDQAGGHDTTAGCIGSYPLIQRRIFSEPNVTIGAVGGGALRETASEPFAQSELGNAADNWAKCYADAIDSAHHEDVDAYDAAAGFVAGYMYRKHEVRTGYEEGYVSIRAEMADLRARLEAAEDKLKEYRLGRLGSL